MNSKNYEEYTAPNVTINEYLAGPIKQKARIVAEVARHMENSLTENSFLDQIDVENFDRPDLEPTASKLAYALERARKTPGCGSATLDFVPHIDDRTGCSLRDFEEQIEQAEVSLALYNKTHDGVLGSYYSSRTEESRKVCVFPDLGIAVRHRDLYTLLYGVVVDSESDTPIEGRRAKFGKNTFAVCEYLQDQSLAESATVARGNGFTHTMRGAMTQALAEFFHLAPDDTRLASTYIGTSDLINQIDHDIADAPRAAMPEERKVSGVQVAASTAYLDVAR